MHPADPKTKPVASESISIGLSVKNMKEAVAALEKKGLKFQVNEEDAIKLAFFADPDGTKLYLVEIKGW